MVRPGRDRFRGRIEVDEAYIGGTDTGGKRGRGNEKKEIVVVALEVHSPKGFGCAGYLMSPAKALCLSSATLPRKILRF